jgi:ribose-phosphate pyrophosphokinase
MTIQLTVDNINVPVKTIKFSDGSSNIQLLIPDHLKQYPPSAYYSISVDPTTPVDAYMWEIALVVSAILNTWPEVGWNKRLLHLPYLPHARADRVFEEGNAFPLQLFTAFVDAVCCELFLTDPHSDFLGDTVETCRVNVKYQHQCFIETVRGIQSGSVLVSPDKGAKSKIYRLQQALDVRSIATFVIEADKKRDIGTGKIIDTTLPEDFDYIGKTFYIVDDLGDGMGTFIPLAKQLKERGAKEVNLYVTHMIGAKGLDILREYIDNVFCYQIVGEYLTMKDVQEYSNSTIKLGD